MDPASYTFLINRAHERLRARANSAPHDGTPESVLAFIALFPDALELVEVVPDQAIQWSSK